MNHCSVKIVTFLIVVIVQKFVLSLPYKLIKVNNICLKISFDPSYIMCYNVPPNSQETAA